MYAESARQKKILLDRLKSRVLGDDSDDLLKCYSIL